LVCFTAGFDGREKELRVVFVVGGGKETEREREKNSGRVFILLGRQGFWVRRGHRCLQKTRLTLWHWCVFATVRWFVRVIGGGSLLITSYVRFWQGLKDA
jgi:hypothetical protein